MKKLGKKLSFLTKIMLVLGFLISNLSSLSVVFASETTIKVEVVEDKLNVKYLSELAEEVENVRVNVYESYTYLDDTFYVDEITNDKEIVSSYDLTLEELDMLVSTDLDKVLVLDSILSDVVFDGMYNVKVEIMDITDEGNEVGELIDSCDYNMPILHLGGLDVSVIDTNTNLLIDVLEDGSYAIDETNTNISVVAKILAGGLMPTDMFMYNGSEYMASELLEILFNNEFNFEGYLYGNYTLPLELELSKFNYETNEYELMDFTDLSIDLLYGTYELDALSMNTALAELELNNLYKFDGNTKDGIVYVLLNSEKTNTMYDLYSVANHMFGDSEIVSYLLSNSEYEDVLATYDEEAMTVSLEEYLASIMLDETTVLTLSNDGLTITYKVLVAGDYNNDNQLTDEDLLSLIDQVIGETEVSESESDLYGDDSKVDTLDVMYLDQVIKNSDWNTLINNELEVSIDALLEVIDEDIVSGGQFTVNYVVRLSDYMINGVAGLFTYDNELLELNSIEVMNDWLGNSKDGKFLYVGSESLELPEVNEDETETVQPDDTVIEDSVGEPATINENASEDEVLEEEIKETLDYIVVSATFTAKKAGTHVINVENVEFFNQNTYYGVEEPASVSVVVNASDNNNLSSLVVAGEIIELVDGQLDYEITVGNEITVADVNAVLENVAASITSIVSPEELVEGENTILITVVSESGVEKVYTIKVIREALEEEEEVTQVYNNYYNDYEDDGESEGGVVITEPEDDEEDDEYDKKENEESNLSRIIIIILILLVIAGLIYLIFKDDDDFKEDTKKINKDVNKLKKEEKKEPEIKKEVKSDDKTTSKSNSNNKTNKNTKNSKK